MRANSLIQHAKNDIVTEVRTIMRKETNHDLKEINANLTKQMIKLNDEVGFLSALCFFQSVTIFFTNIVMISVYS